MTTIYKDIERRVEDVTEIYGEYNSLHEAFPCYWRR